MTMTMATKMTMSTTLTMTMTASLTMGRRWPGRRQAVEEEVEVRMRAADWRRTMLTAATTKAMTMRMAVMMRMAMMTMLIDEVAKAKQIFHHLYL